MKLSFWILFFVFAFSVNCTSDEEDEVSDNEDIIENEDLPAHRFVQEEKVVKSGKSKGQKKQGIQYLNDAKKLWRTEYCSAVYLLFFLPFTVTRTRGMLGMTPG